VSEKKPPEKTRRLPTVQVVQVMAAPAQGPSKALSVAELRERILSEARMVIEFVTRGYDRHPELVSVIERLKRAVQAVK
jgi:hypothetical protein